MGACGVLALQGDWNAHRAILRELGREVLTVRTRSDLENVDALVIPGGESSAMIRLADSDNLFARIGEKIAAGMTVLATCAGVILLAETVAPDQPSLGALAVTVIRNAYGRQVHSTVGEVTLEPELGLPGQMEGVFIRAPRITQVRSSVEVLGRWGSDPVLVREKGILGATFHPELGSDRRVHELFLRMGEEGHG